jgi:hypothetical protein
MQMGVTELQSNDSLKDVFSKRNILQFYAELPYFKFPHQSFHKKKWHLVALTSISKQAF